MRKHQWLIGLGLLGLIVGLTACGTSDKNAAKNSGYQSSLSKGLDAVAQDKMSKAVSYFQNALDQKPKDKKATAYLKQAEGYQNGKQQLNAGDPAKAEKTVSATIKVKNGAKSLTTKLTALQKEVKADVKEYDKIKAKLTEVDKQVAAQQFDEAQAGIDAIKDTDWVKKPYLKKLKTQFDQLSKQVAENQSQASSSSVVATSDNSNDNANHQKAEGLRQSLVQSSAGMISASELAKVPDSVVLAAERESAGVGGDIGYTGRLIAKQYPSVKIDDQGTDSEPSSGIISEDEVPWAPGAQATFDAGYEPSYGDQKIVGFQKYDNTLYCVFVEGRSDPYVTVNINTGDFHG